MKMTLNTIETVEDILGCIEGNKKNAVINSILIKSFLSGSSNESLIEFLSQKEINKIIKKIEKMKVNILKEEEYLDESLEFHEKEGGLNKNPTQNQKDSYRKLREENHSDKKKNWFS